MRKWIEKVFARKSVKINVTSVDYAPEDLYEQTPFTATLLRQVAGPDRPDYWIAELGKPLQWTRDDSTSAVTHLIVAARWVGGTLTSSMRNTPINISYVTDTSVLTDVNLDFEKCSYVAIGVADAL